MQPEIVETTPLSANLEKVRAAQIHMAIGPKLNVGPWLSTHDTPAAARNGWLRAVSVDELRKLDVKKREMILHPFLPTQGLAMLYSKRGVGKTFLSLGISLAVASGTQFLKWHASAARKVLYVDGEMPLSSLKQRVSDILAGTNIHPDFYSNLQLITPDVQSRGLPDLATVSGQDEIEEHLEGVNLLVLDNLSSLVRACKENEGEGLAAGAGLGPRSPSPRHQRAFRPSRRQGRSAARHLEARGSTRLGGHPETSRRLCRLRGLHCIVEYEKARGFYGEDAKSFEVKMCTGPSGEAEWTVLDLEASADSRIAELKALGMSVREIAEELGMKRSTVHRHLQNLELSHSRGPRE